MLSQLCRSLSRPPKASFSDPKSIQENIQRNLATLADYNNYTKDRILRVIRSYFFLHLEKKKLKDNKPWGSDPAIQDSVRRLTPLIRQLDPDSVNILIVNLSLLHVFNQSTWREIENQFVDVSHKYLPTHSLVKICESFQLAKRKNAEVWGIINDRFLCEIYAAGQLEAIDAARTLRNLAMIKEGSQELIEKLEENVISTLVHLQLKDLMMLLEGLSVMSNKNMDLVRMVVNKSTEIISRTSAPRFSNVLMYAARIGNFELISNLEELVLKKLDREEVLSLSKVVMNYGKEEFVKSKERRQFAEVLSKYFRENREKFVKEFRDKAVFAMMEMKFIYPIIAAKGEVSDEEVARILRDTEGLTELSLLSQAMRGEIEEYLKNKNFI